MYGDIVEEKYFENDVECISLVQQNENAQASEINVYVNSYGGSVSAGLAIHNALKRHNAKVKTVCDGFACSAASVIFMAGDERVMNTASLLMIHNAWTWASGNSAELRKQADDLEIITQASVNAYMERVNIAEDRVKELMDAESWILPVDALEMGFATSVTTDQASSGANQSAKKAVFQMMTAPKQQEPTPTEPTDPPPAEPEDPEQNTLHDFLQALSAGRR